MVEMNPGEQLNYDMSILDSYKSDRDKLIIDLELQSAKIKGLTNELAIEKNKLSNIQEDIDAINNRFIEVMKRRNMKTAEGFTLVERKQYIYKDDEIIKQYPELTRVKVELDKEKAKEKIITLLDNGLVEVTQTEYLRSVDNNGIKFNKQNR